MNLPNPAGELAELGGPTSSPNLPRFSVSSMDALLAEVKRSTLAALPPDQPLRAQPASLVAVTEAHNNYLAATAGALSGPLLPPPPVPVLGGAAPGPPAPSCTHREASRTLYVGGLERKVKEEVLRQRFGRFGHIVEVSEVMGKGKEYSGMSLTVPITEKPIKEASFATSGIEFTENIITRAMT